MFNSKIVITGMGIVSPLGSDISQAVSRLSNGKSGIKIDQDNPYCHFSAQVEDYEMTKYVPAKKIRRMEKINHFAINAAGLALDDAKLTEDYREDTGVLVGTGYAGIESVIKHQESLLDQGIEQLRPIHFPTTVYNATAGMIAIEHSLKGINSTLTGLDMPGEYCLLHAALILQRQPESKIIVIGADPSSEQLSQGVSNLGFLTKAKDDQAKRVFEDGCDGIIMGEGAAALVLETKESALARGANILAELNGIYQHSTNENPYNYASSPSAIFNALDQLLTGAQNHIQDYDLINLSANGVPSLNSLEQAFLERLADSPIPARTLVDYVGAFPGGGILRLALAISALKEKAQIKSLQDTNVQDKLLPALSMEIKGFSKLMHITNGLGGNAMAIDIEVA